MGVVQQAWWWSSCCPVQRIDNIKPPFVNLQKTPKNFNHFLSSSISKRPSPAAVIPLLPAPRRFLNHSPSAPLAGIVPNVHWKKRVLTKRDAYALGHSHLQLRQPHPGNRHPPQPPDAYVPTRYLPSRIALHVELVPLLCRVLY